jgi:hypothetical protein
VSLRRNARTPKATGSVKITVNTDQVVAGLEAMNNRVHAAVRPAAQAGAQLIYEAVHFNLDTMLGKQCNVDIRGVLKSAIYQKFITERSVEGLIATYHVSWNSSKAPHAWLVEYGHRQIYRTYFSRFDGKFHTAVRPEKAADFKAYAGKKIPPNLRPVFFYPAKQPITIVPPVPFMRKAIAELDAAGKEVEKVIWKAVNSKFSPATKVGAFL